MIHMPRRNVTRFAIPLIDVLILLFCIFLLMEFNSESEVDRQTEVVEDQTSDINKLQAMLYDRIKELQPWNRGEQILVLKDGTELTVGRAYRRKLERILQNIVG